MTAATAVSARRASEAIAAAPVAVRVEGLSKRYPLRRTWAEILRRPFDHRRTTVLNDISLDVPAGEFFGLLGPNGAGKSTLFKILATLVLADDGRVEIDGIDVRRRPSEARHRVAPVIADERSLAWRLSARENLRLYAALHGLRGRDATNRVDHMLELVGLEETGAQLVAKFSSGMRQRLMIARGLLAQPRVLLLDEPTRSLDPPAARRFRTFLRDEIAARQGCTVLLATHNTEEALELCDRVGVLNKGSLLAVGTPAELGREVAEERYHVWTARADAASVTRATGPMLRILASRDAEAAGWQEHEVEIRGGEAAASEALRRIVSSGITVARFERVRVSLADLIERIIARRQTGA